MANEVDEHGLALSAADAQPRLKWTRQLHQCFVDAVSQLGGPDKATPKSVMRMMGIPGITLYHLKSHLQKYRLATNRDHKENNKIEDTITTDYNLTENVIPIINENMTQPQFDNSRTMLLLQMEVQRKLQEQLEKHLQLRIEAQGKYLQSVLRKAHETLASYSLGSMDMEAADAELSELVSVVDTAECPSSLLSPATCVSKQFLNVDCSTDSCLTSSERPELLNGKQHNSLETSDCSNSWSAESNEISFKEGTMALPRSKNVSAAPLIAAGSSFLLSISRESLGLMPDVGGPAPPGLSVGETQSGDLEVEVHEPTGSVVALALASDRSGVFSRSTSREQVSAHFLHSREDGTSFITYARDASRSVVCKGAGVGYASVVDLDDS